MEVLPFSVHAIGGENWKATKEFPCHLTLGFLTLCASLCQGRNLYGPNGLWQDIQNEKDMNTMLLMGKRVTPKEMR